MKRLLLIVVLAVVAYGCEKQAVVDCENKQYPTELCVQVLQGE